MSSNIPIVLQGSTLGQRHRQYYDIVNKAFQQKVDKDSVLQSEELTPIDRLYKIDLASKYRDVDYILQNLKDDDMLYVSRALKSHWLLEPQYRDVINPRYLEDEVFPHMIQPAVNKMRHWLQKNLRDNSRCQEFYEYYKDRHDIAIKFFWHCSSDYKLIEIKNILYELSPQDLKVLCETCPQVSRVYLEELPNNKEALGCYVRSEETYFKSFQCVLKMDPQLYLDIVEKYFNLQIFGNLSPVATRYIMKNHKDRFSAKPELYAAYILHMETLAGFLTSKEAKNLVLKLARAEDIISYSNVFRKVEPIVKRVNIKEREAFKKKVFVEKAYGNKLKEWPYPIPVGPKLEETYKNTIFNDKCPSELDDIDDCMVQCSMSLCYAEANMGCFKMKTPLDILFDKYRFKGFAETYKELCKKLQAESTVAGRMNIFLVLVSKSGGVPKQVDKLLTLLVTKHLNEPSNLRAAVIRSLVKRAYAWRLPNVTWNLMMKFGQNLGLDGNEDELECEEGLHAVVIRHFIKNEPLPDKIKSAFLEEISTFKEYKLKSDEKRLVGPKLAKTLLDGDPNNLLEVLVDYKLNIKDVPGAELNLVEKARSDEELLCRLYKNRIDRRFLLKETFALFDKEESFRNALKHDTSVLDNGESFKILVNKKRPNHDRFVQSLALYFNESGGLAEQHRAKLLKAMKTYPQPWFARVINILSTNIPLSDILKEIDIEKKEINKSLVAAFKATTHKSRPYLNIKGVDLESLKWLGAKAVANKALICKEEDRESFIKKLLQWRRTARIAIRLGLNSKSSTETFIAASKLRPAVALKVASKTYLRNKTIDPQVWEVTKQLIETQHSLTDETRKYLYKQLKNNDNVPENIEAEYWETLYKVFIKIDQKKTIPILIRLENIQAEVNPDFIRSIMETFVNEELVLSKFTNDYTAKKIKTLYVRMLAKYLLTSTSEHEQEERLKNICDLFFEKIHELRKTMKENTQICSLYDLLRKFVHGLKYNQAFLGNYASCYVVFERILENMKKILPKEKYFALYLETHLIILYYKSLQQSIEKNPEIFMNLEKNLNEATETVGLQMGRNVGLEIRDLLYQYRFSIIDIYKRVLVQFLDDFNFYYGKNPIVTPVIKGLLEVGQTQSLLLAEYVVKKRDHYLPGSAREELVNDLEAFNNETVNFFLNAN